METLCEFFSLWNPLLPSEKISLTLKVTGFWWSWVVMASFGWLWLVAMGGCGWLRRVAVAGFGWLWVVLCSCGWFWVVLDGCGWFWVVVAGFGWLRVLYLMLTQAYPEPCHSQERLFKHYSVILRHTQNLV